jgi:hypothetical protein
MYERMSCSANGVADAVGTKGAREVLVWGGVVVAADIVVNIGSLSCVTCQGLISFRHLSLYRAAK